MGLIHLLAHSLVVAGNKGVANGQHAVFLAQHEMGTGVVFLTHLGTHFLQLLPGAVAKGLKLALRMLGGDVFHHVLA